MTIKDIERENKKSYKYMKLFCEEIELEQIDNTVLKTYIPINKSKQIARELIYNITPELIDYFDVYIKNNLILESGDFNKSIYNNINYGENIVDVYVLIHEFYNYYINIICKYGLAGFPYILNLSKSIMSEEIARNLIEKNKVNLSDYNIQISNEELNYLKKLRIFNERKAAGHAVFLHNIFLLDENLNKYEVIKEFEEKDKNSIEYKSYKENEDDKVFYYLGNSAIYATDYSKTQEHPMSYLVALDLLYNSNNKETFKSILNAYHKNRARKLYDLRNIQDIKSDFNYSIIKDLSIDETKEQEIRKVLRKEYQSIKEL